MVAVYGVVTELSDDFFAFAYDYGVYAVLSAGLFRFKLPGACSADDDFRFVFLYGGVVEDFSELDGHVGFSAAE